MTQKSVIRAVKHNFRIILKLGNIWNEFPSIERTLFLHSITCIKRTLCVPGAHKQWNLAAGADGIPTEPPIDTNNSPPALNIIFKIPVLLARQTSSVNSKQLNYSLSPPFTLRPHHLLRPPHAHSTYTGSVVLAYPKCESIWLIKCLHRELHYLTPPQTLIKWGVGVVSARFKQCVSAQMCRLNIRDVYGVSYAKRGEKGWCLHWW